MDVVRTPDDRFADLPDWPYAPTWVHLADGLRVHVVDEGPRDAAPVLLMHGEPSWAYLYRHVIPPLVDAGHRVVVPDLVGFGRSDKPTTATDYTYARHVAWMREALLDRLDLRDVTLFGQDWGGLTGLRLVAEHPDRFAAVVVGNTGLPTGEQQMSEAFLAWQRWSQETEHFPVGTVVDGGCLRDLAPGEVDAYDAPFHEDAATAGARIFPALVPTRPDDPAADDQRAAWASLARFDRPFLCAFSDSDPLTAGADGPFRDRVPGARGQPHRTIEGAGHFLQEDAPGQVADAILAVLE